MKGKRVLLADMLFNTSLVNVFSRFFEHNKLVILNYHRIRSASIQLPTPFDDGVFNVTENVFFQQMKWLKRHSRILSEEEIIDEIITNSCSVKEQKVPLVAITFDDGYLDNYSTAFPILKSLQIPAFFFICTEMIWERKLRWWDILAYLIKSCKKPFIVINDTEYLIQDNRQLIIADFQLQLKFYPAEYIQKYIQLISDACEIDLPSNDLQDRELMTQDQIREMAEHLMTIGSHTHTHQALSSLDDRLHQTELTVSKQLLEQATGQPVKSVSYPFGRYQFVPLSIQNAARKCGYQLGFTSSSGVNYLNEIHPMVLNRFPGFLDRISTFALITVWPELFAIKEESSQFHKLFLT